MSSTSISRRTLAATGAAVALGVLSSPGSRAIAQSAATPQPVRVSQGYVSTRVRTVASAEARAEINEIVVDEFIPEVRELEGYRGYLLGNVIENDAQSVSVVVLGDAAHVDAFDDLAADFVDDLGELAESLETRQWEGSLFITGEPAGQLATPAGSTAGTAMRDGHAVIRVHNAAVGTSPMDFIPLGTEDFIARMEVLEGFRGYLWYPTEGGFVSISLFDTEASAEASRHEAADGETALLADATAGDPEVYNASIVWAELPVLST